MSPFILSKVEASDTPLFVGVAVTQTWLEAELREQKITVYNDPDGWRYIVRHLAESKRPLHVVCESADRWESGIVSALQAAGIPVSLADARAVFEFSACTSAEEISPVILARYGETHRDSLEFARPTKPISALFPRAPVKVNFWDGLAKSFAALARALFLRPRRTKSPPSA